MADRFCTTCPVWTGACPNCGTFWWERGGKRHGLRPVPAALSPVGPTAGVRRWTDPPSPAPTRPESCS